MATIGLISDTHMPHRRRALPAAVFDLLSGVDVVLHGGDVGELWVLEQLSRIAPVFAVFGNDEPEETRKTLPHMIPFNAGGRHMLLVHGHALDTEFEFRLRAETDWAPKLRFWSSYGRDHGADIVIYGHTHIPGVIETEGVTLINPGAVSSAGLMRQTVSTVARMEVTADAPPQVTIYDLATGAVHTPETDLTLPFEAIRVKYGELIFAPDLMAQFKWFRTALLDRFGLPILDPLLGALYARWEGDAPPLTVEDMAAAYREAQAQVPGEAWDALWANPDFARYREVKG